ncbi:hypothetical protein ScPMuIL_000864 [Solemya velum]
MRRSTRWISYQDAMESDLDKDEILKPEGDELSGEPLLAGGYLTRGANSARARRRQQKDFDGMNEPLRRPVTPSHRRLQDPSRKSQPSLKFITYERISPPTARGALPSESEPRLSGSLALPITTRHPPRVDRRRLHKGERRVTNQSEDVPHREVPILIDGDVTVFDGQPILRYLGQNYTGHAGFGMTSQKQMMCDSIISWANAELHRAVGYSYIYPQFLEKYSLTPESANEALIESGLRQLSRHLEILETRYLEKNKYLTGDRISVADSFVASIVVLLEWTGFKFTIWPKVAKWLERTKHQEYWDTVHVTHTDFIKELKRANVILD